MIYNPRRPYYDEDDGRSDPRYMESDMDYVNNNMELAVKLLDEYGERLKTDKEKKHD